MLFRSPEDGAFLYDPREGLGLRVITDNALEKALQREGMKLERSIPLTNDSWGAAADRLLSAMNGPQKDHARSTLLTVGKFCVWRKQV